MCYELKRVHWREIKAHHKRYAKKSAIQTQHSFLLLSFNLL